MWRNCARVKGFCVPASSVSWNSWRCLREKRFGSSLVEQHMAAGPHLWALTSAFRPGGQSLTTIYSTLQHCGSQAGNQEALEFKSQKEWSEKLDKWSVPLWPLWLWAKGDRLCNVGCYILVSWWLQFYCYWYVYCCSVCFIARLVVLYIVRGHSHRMWLNMQNVGQWTLQKMQARWSNMSV